MGKKEKVNKANIYAAAKKIAKHLGGAHILKLTKGESSLFGCKYLVGKVKKKK